METEDIHSEIVINSSPVEAESPQDVQPAGELIEDVTKPQHELGLLNWDQEKMLDQYLILGIPGLRDSLYEYVSRKFDEEPSRVSWGKFKTWMEQSRWVDFYLASMHPRFLRALLEGNVGYKYVWDLKTQKCIEKNHKLKPGPQIYLNVCVQTKHIGTETSQIRPMDQQRSENEGYGPSVGQILQTFSDMEFYLDLDNPDAVEFAKKIDRAVNYRDKVDPNVKRILDRKYIPSSKAHKFLEQWVEKLKEVFEKLANGMSNEHVQTKLQWAFSEVGFGLEGDKRAHEHKYHRSTNHLFGLFTACLIHRYQDEFEIHEHAIMDIMEPEHANNCEILGSLLAGSYGHGEGRGLNPTHAGGLPMSGPNNLRAPGIANLWARMQFDTVNDEKRRNVFKKSDQNDDRLISLIPRIIRIANMDYEKEMNAMREELSKIQRTLDERKMRQTRLLKRLRKANQSFLLV